MNQLALRGQAIYDLHAGVFRWRQVLPMALSDRELGEPHPELTGAETDYRGEKSPRRSPPCSPAGRSRLSPAKWRTRVVRC